VGFWLTRRVGSFAYRYEIAPFAFQSRALPRDSLSLREAWFFLSTEPKDALVL